eukprot:5860792-Amphidinium_carterae.2
MGAGLEREQVEKVIFEGGGMFTCQAWVAKELTGSQAWTFCKDKDGMLNALEIAAYSKGEFAFEVSEEASL